jgi:Hint domain
MYSWKNAAWGTVMTDTSLAYTDGLLSDAGFGIVAGTKVATSVGWRPVEAIIAGDKVLTFDGGLQTVIEVRRVVLFAGATMVPMDCWPLHVPAGALGNRSDMQIMPCQNVLMESDTAEDLYGDPFVLIPAIALEGFNCISRIAPAARVEVVTLHFAQDQIVYANIGALFMCPRAGDLMHDLFAMPEPAVYRTLTLAEADEVLAGLEKQGGGLAVHA